MFANRTRERPVRVSPLLGTSRPEQVSRAVVRALRDDSAQIIVNPGPVRALLAAQQLSPDLIAFVQRRLLSLNGLMRTLALAARTPSSGD